MTQRLDKEDHRLDAHPVGDTSATSRRAGLPARIWRALAGEFANLNFRMVLAHSLVALLPGLTFPRLRTAIYRLAGIKIGARTLLLGSIELIGGGAVQDRIRIGSGTIINKRLFADVTGDIRIGDRVSIGHHVVLITAGHEIGRPEFRAGTLLSRPIEIENGCWIGARTTILPGVIIGASSIVAAGSLVSSHVPPNKMVGGVPARLIKSLLDGA